MKMTWNEFQSWQSWDEFPELKDNPPLTIDVIFFYAGKKYQIDHMHSKNAVADFEEGYYLWDVSDGAFTAIGHRERFIDVLKMPVLDGKSFAERIEELYIEC